MPFAGRPRDPSSVSGAIIANRLTGVAPMGVFLQAGQSGFSALRPGHELRYKWRFPAAGEFAALGGAHPWSTAREIAYGPFAAHVLESPGTHVITLEVTDGTQTAIETVEITVADPDMIFAGPQTFAISASGFDGAPSGATQVATLADARAILGASGMRNARFLFARGQSHDIGGGAGTFSGGAVDNLQFGAFGTGTDPALTGGGLRTEGDLSSGAVAVWGLRMSGGFDAATGAGAGSAGIGLDLHDAATHCISGCTIEGFDHGLRGATGLHNVVVSDCVIRGWAQEGVVFQDADAVALVGCAVLPGPGALATHVAGGPGRIEGAAPGRAVLWQCDLHSITEAPCWRWNAGGAPDATGIIGACLMEGGAPVLEIAPSNAGGTDREGDLVVERCYLLGNDRTGADGTVKLTLGGTTLRNCIAVLPDVAPLSGVDAKAFVTGAAPNTNAANDVSPVRIHSNTFVDLRSAATLVDATKAFAEVDASDFAHWTNAEVVNQLPHAPYLQTPIDQHAPFATDAAFVPRSAGTPSGSASLWRPFSKSTSVDAAGAGTIALDGYFGELREIATAERGAHEVGGSFQLSPGGPGGFLATGIDTDVAELEVAPPNAYEGVYPLDVSAIGLGPVQLRAPEITGDYTVGGTVEAKPSLVAWDPALGRPVQLFQWLRGSTPIEGAVGTTHVVTQEDIDQGLYLREQVANAGPIMLDETATLIRPTFVQHGIYTDVFSWLIQNEVLSATPVNEIFLFCSCIHGSGNPLHIGNMRVQVHFDRVNLLLIAGLGVEHSFSVSHSGIATGQRFNFCLSANHATGAIKIALKLDGGAWATVLDTVHSFDGTGFDFSGAPTEIYKWYTCTSYRYALFLSKPDLVATDTAVQDNFALPSGDLVDPFISQSLYGLAVIDVYGDAAFVQSGAHHGTSGPLQIERTLTDV